MQRWIRTCLVLLVILIPTWGGFSAPQNAAVQTAESILAEMSPEEKVGQLFLVTFDGSSVPLRNSILELITNHHIAGVLLRIEANNFQAAPDTLSGANDLIHALQDAAYNASVGEGEEGDDPPSPYVPLLIAIAQEGGGPQFAEILTGMTELPSEMAIGASWDLELAKGVGEVLGRELEALGFNLLFGPSLDVLEDPRLAGPGDLGIRSFGGDPFWVSELGKSFIAGLHEGSVGRLAVIVKHFPGLGSADRSIEEEVATVRKSLEQLKQIELAPFFAVTQMIPGDQAEIADGFLTSHIRYQGLQGNIRDTTRPVSMDPQAHDLLMSLEPIATWREGGGITVSDSLGSRAVRRFRDPLERTFFAHHVARDAFLAGNDLLLLTDVKNPDDPDELTTIVSILNFFAQKYRDDTAFAQRVDQAVERILELKLRMYDGVFDLARVKDHQTDLSQVGQGADVTFEVARAAATLITPAQNEIEERLGGPPGLSERIVFFTDVRVYQQCDNCEQLAGLSTTILEEMITTLYGQAAAGQVGTWNMQSFTMADLANYLGEPPPAFPSVPIVQPDQLEEPLQVTDWLVFSILNNTNQVYGSNALKLLLDSRPDLARQKKVVVFAFDVPYDLDATDLSKIDAAYALYSQGYPFVDVAAHLLFREHSAQGAASVSIPGIGYDLIAATSPDPDQIISLTVFEEGQTTSSPETEPEFSVGDTVLVETGIIVDLNGHPVPDGTVVEFPILYPGDTVPTITLKATTTAGVARIGVELDRLGLLSISARSDPAWISDTLQINAQEDVPALATVISPTLIPTDTPPPTATVPQPTPTLETGATEGELDVEDNIQMGVDDLLLGLFGVVAVAGAGYFGTSLQRQNLILRFRCTFLPIITGLLGYNYLALGFPGSSTFFEWFGIFATLVGTILTGVVGLVLARVWCRR